MRRIAIFLAAILATLNMSAQTQSSSEPADSLVSLISAKSMALLDSLGATYRKVIGPARFLHNDTFLLCDTALWNVNQEEIIAIGNVKILQEQTVLTGDKLTYLIPQDLAQFRGSLVQLEDKDHNVLRTHFLDYNTKDSVAVFFNGGSMKDKDGQIIESDKGTYDSKAKLFTFTRDVNMFTDSIFVSSDSMKYHTDSELAVFGTRTHAWREDDMLSSQQGWYDKLRDLFLFNDEVHLLSPTREGWSDSLYFNRSQLNIEMLGNVQLTDTLNNASALAGKVVYTDSLSRVTMSRKPAVVGLDKENPTDTLFFSADTLIYRTIPRCEIDSAVVNAAQTRLAALGEDAVMSHRKKAAEAAAAAAAAEAAKDPNRVAEAKSKAAAQAKEGKQVSTAPAEEKSKPTAKDGKPDTKPDARSSMPAPADSLSQGADSLNSLTDSLGVLSDSLGVAADSLGSAADSLAVPKDSTKVGFMWAIRNAKLYRGEMQMACDSLEYCDLDSLARLFGSPLIWNEQGKHQYAADSVYAVIKNGRADRADLLDNAFIIVQEDTLCFDQIRSTEMIAYFDENTKLHRYDALGEVNAIFYLKEDSTYASVNKSSAKMMYVVFKEGELDTVTYFEEAKSDAYPLAQMKKEDRVLKGYNWQPDKRPSTRNDVTDRKFRTTEREQYESVPKAKYTQTELYFPGYMDEVRKQIAQNAERRRLRSQAQAHADSVAAVQKDSIAMAHRDSLNNLKDSLSVSTDSLETKKDSLSAGLDSISVKIDSIKTTVTPASAKELARKAKEAARKAKAEAKKLRWDQLDSLDAAKAKAKLDRKAAKVRKKKLEALKEADAQAVKDAARLEKYKAIYEKRKSRQKPVKGETLPPPSEED